MIPEHRLDRAERLITLIIKAGYRERRERRKQMREQDEKINILISAQIRNEEERLAHRQENNEQVKRLHAAQERTDKALAELSEEHKLTERSLRAFIDSLTKGRNGKDSL